MALTPEALQAARAHIAKHKIVCPVCGGEVVVSEHAYEIRPYTGGGINLSMGGPPDPALIVAFAMQCKACSHLDFFRG